MAAADPPAGLMDIASTLSQDEIPFKLRCATCNKLAVNAFRLPCCDQSICETCQASLPDTCSVCAHSPLSPDLCKPNKALRTTLKAFLRTEEKKREKERQSAAPVTPQITTPAENDTNPTEAVVEPRQPDVAPVEVPETAAPAESKPVEAANEASAVDAVTETDAPESAVLANEAETNGYAEATGHQAPHASTAPATDTDAQPNTNGDEPAGDESALKNPSEQSDANMINAGPGGFPGMGGWNGNTNTNFNGMNPYMANPMFNFPNGMGMPMTMDQMAANQGMYGMNMTGMGMNMGMNFNGQGMYGSSGWDGSQQNMWQGGQDNFNPNAFANGTGPPYGGAFGGSNMSYPSNSDFQSSYYGSGYGRGGGYRGRGRGYYHGSPGRGGYGGSGQGHFPPTGSSGLPNGQLAPGGGPAGTDGTSGNTEDPSQMNENAGTDPLSNANAQSADGTAETATNLSAADNQGQQLQGIPTIDSLDQASGAIEPNGYQTHMGPGYGRGGYMRGPMPGGRGGGYWGGMPGSYQPQMPPQNPGVEGAPAAPRAMRQGLPNTSVLRQRGFHAHGKVSVSSNTPTLSQRGNSEAPQDATRTRSSSKAPSQALVAGSRSCSPSQGPTSRALSPDDNRGSHRQTDSQRPDTMRQPQLADRRSRSPSRMSSRRSSRRRDRDEDRDRKSGHRSHRSRRHHSRANSRSPSPMRNGESRHSDRLKQIGEEKEPSGHVKVSSDTGDRGDLASRISNGHRSGRDGHSRREDDRDRDRDRDRARDGRRRDKDREQDRRDRGRDRDSERDRHQNRDRERERDRERDRGGDRERDRGRDRGADRERERKRRRDRSESPNVNTNDRSSQPQARRVKTNGEERDRDQPRAPAAKTESEKDPYTLEREARNRERLLREQQNRGSVKSSNSKSSHRRDSRQERLVGGRRINYKYEDEL